MLSRKLTLHLFCSSANNSNRGYLARRGPSRAPQDDDFLHLVAVHRVAQDDSDCQGCEGGNSLVGGLQPGLNLWLRREKRLPANAWIVRTTAYVADLAHRHHGVSRRPDSQTHQIILLLKLLKVELHHPTALSAWKQVLTRC